jgi:hypothetical protein
MNSYHYRLLSLLILSYIFSGILAAYPENYTIPYLFSVRIGSHSTEIKLLLNSFSSNNILFTNTNRKYSKEISAGRKSDVYMDKLEFSGHIIPEFAFSLQLDNTGLNSPEIQGEFGLGIDKDNRNDLIENLFVNQIITKRKIILETSNNLVENIIHTITESDANEFKYCNLTRKSDLDNLYDEAWVCELSHLIEEDINIDEKNIKSVWENAKEIHSRAVFDTRQKYIILPIKYLDDFKFYGIEKCEVIFDESLSQKYFKCNNKVYEKIKDDISLYFLIDGYGFKFSINELFQSEGDYKSSLIRFTNTISNSNLFIFGIPLFKRYKIMFDYENKRLGFKGENIIDFSEYYNDWKEEKSVIKINESNVASFDLQNEKIIMVIGAFIGGIIILYVLFFMIRDNKRNNINKIHSNFVEQVKDY